MGFLNSVISTFVLIVILNSNLFAQSSSKDIDQKIIDVYGTLYVNNLKSSAPERIAYLKFLLDNSFEIKEIQYNISEKFTKVSAVSINTKFVGNIQRPTFNPNNFNILLYNFKRDRKNKTVYRIDNTNKVIVFNSEEENAKAFNQIK